MSEGATKDIWHDDLLERKKYARFLTKMVRQRCEPLEVDGKRRSFTMALDGDWGAGKTFFVQRWAQELRSEQLAIIEFDAWKCDSTSEPLTALIAEIKKQLDPLVSKLPPAQKATGLAQDVWNSAISAARRIAVPAGKIVAGAALKQITGESIDSIFRETAPDNEDTLSQATDAMGALSEKLSAQFEKEYEARQQSTRVFREKLEKTIDALHQHKIVTAPLVVMIDELDRCRPDFAIRLIETVKHLFDVPGVAFVLATNTRQLAESIRAVYGSGFDADHYLQRFFDLIYRMPAPNLTEFSRFLFRDWPSNLSQLSRHSFITNGAHVNELQARLFSVICMEFDLDLRAQRRAFQLSVATASALPDNVANHPLFLFFICSLYERHRNAWSSFWTRSEPASDDFKDWYDGRIRRVSTSNHPADQTVFFSNGERSYSVFEIIHRYRKYALMTTDEYRGALNRRPDDSERNSLASQLLADMNRFGRKQRCPIYDYKEIVEMAGQII